MSNISPEYQEMLDAIKADKEKADSGGSRKYWTPPSDKEGTFPVRFLPPLKKLGEKKFYFDHKNHWIDGQSFECLNQTLVDKDGNLHEAIHCPACAMSKKFYKIADNNKNSDEFKLAGDLSGKQRYIYKVIVRGTDDETTPKFYETGITIFKNLYHILTETDYGIIVDPKNGRDYNIVKVGKGRRTKYDQSLPAANVSPIFTEADQVKDCIGKALKMSYNSLIEFVSSETMEKALRELLDPDADESPVTATTVTNSPAVQETVVASIATPAVEEEPDEVDSELDDILGEFEDM
jgi:hypothetical protein